MSHYVNRQKATVEEVHFPGKAILTYNLNGEKHRVLLWVKNYIHQGVQLQMSGCFNGILSQGDQIYFDGHTYDNDSKDACGWYAAKAYKEIRGPDEPIKLNRLVSQTGTILELDAGKGVLVCYMYDVEERVFFLRSKFHLFGKRIGNKHSLREFIAEDEAVQFDAELCAPNADNRNCRWFASLVWKGKKPPFGTQIIQPVGNVIYSLDDIGTEDSDSNCANTGKDFSGPDDFPELGTSSSSHIITYKMLEQTEPSRQGKGKVLSLFDEECGLALWIVAPNTWETVFFHRRNTFLDHVSLKTFDLRESIGTDTMMQITAVPAVPEFPCRWIAQKAVVDTSASLV